MKNLLYVWNICSGMALSLPLSAQTYKPNIVFIMADDLGWSDLGIMGSDFHETPNIDRLASEGLLFDNAYASAANSAPSRACIMTGMYTPYHGVYTVSPSERGEIKKRRLIPIKNTEDVRTEFVTIAEILQQQGYQCAQIGKWHLGDDKDGTGPLSQGFVWNVGGDRSGSPYSYFYSYCNKNKNYKCHLNLDSGVPGEYLTDRLTEEAISFIEANRDHPFFLYLSHYAVHVALQAPESLVEKYRNIEKGKYHSNLVYAAMIEKIDDSVGKIVSTLERLGIEDKTLVIFYSDNGGSEPVTDNYPLRGGKGMPYEGGIRVPLIMKWPGRIERGLKVSIPVTGVDFYPTFVSLAKGNPAKDLCGKDIFSLLQKKEKRDLFWHFPAYLESYLNSGKDFRATPFSIIRSGNWKLIYYYENDNVELFNLEDDLMELSECSEDNPYIVKKMKKKLFRWIKKTKAPIPTEKNPYYDG